jgi:hypothetical protein
VRVARLPSSRGRSTWAPHGVHGGGAGRLVLELTGSTAALTFSRARDDPKLRRPDIGRARELLGFEPR